MISDHIVSACLSLRSLWKIKPRKLMLGNQHITDMGSQENLRTSLEDRNMIIFILKMKPLVCNDTSTHKYIYISFFPSPFLVQGPSFLMYIYDILIS